MKNLITNIDDTIAEAILETLNAARKPLTGEELVESVAHRLGNGDIAEEDEILETLETMVRRSMIRRDENRYSRPQ